MAEAEKRPELTLSEREQILLDLLMAGHTDASAARRMSVSARTVTNILRSLMDRCHVNNRFQLGVAMGRFRLVAGNEPPAAGPSGQPRFVTVALGGQRPGAVPRRQMFWAPPTPRAAADRRLGRPEAMAAGMRISGCAMTQDR
jgi:DNA-binding CsgD family transcriptional regulator